MEDSLLLGTQLLFHVREYVDVLGTLALELEDLLVAFFDLLVQRLILDLEFLKVDQVEAFRQLLLAGKALAYLVNECPHLDHLKP